MLIKMKPINSPQSKVPHFAMLIIEGFFDEPLIMFTTKARASKMMHSR